MENKPSGLKIVFIAMSVVIVVEFVALMVVLLKYLNITNPDEIYLGEDDLELMEFVDSEDENGEL